MLSERKAARPQRAQTRPKLADHAPFLVLLGAAAALRVLVTLAYWQGLELGGDSFNYLRYASSLTPGFWHPFGYSLFLRALAVFGSLGVVPIVQHLLGLALGLVIYALLLRLGVRRGLALLATVPVLFDGYQLDIEQFVLAETLVDALVLAAFALMFWNRRIGARRAAVVGALLTGAVLTRVTAVPLLVVAGLYLLLRSQWRSVFSYTTVAIALLIGYGAWYATWYGSFSYTDYSGYELYARVAPFATCDYDLPSKEARLCPRQPVSRRTKNTDFYIWKKGSPLSQPGLGRHHQRDGLARQFAIDVIEHQPLDYASAVLADTWHYFSPGRWMTADRIELERYRFPDATSRYSKDDLHVTVANVGFGHRPIRPDPLPSLYEFLRAYQSVIYTQGPLLLAALIGGLVAALGLFRRDRRRREARWAAALFATGGLLIVFVPSLTAPFSYRSGTPLLVLLPPAGIIGADLAMDALQTKVGRRKARVGAPAGVSAPGLEGERAN